MKNYEKSEKFTIPTSHNPTQTSETPKLCRIGISKLQKRFYPLNYTLSDTPKPATRKINKRKREMFPEFLQGFVNENFKQRYSTSCKIDARNTFTRSCGSDIETIENFYRDLHPPVSVEIPQISYQSFRGCSQEYETKHERDEKLYRPNTIYFSNRSKMVLYSQTPICYNLPQYKKIQIKKRVLTNELFKLKNKKKKDEKHELVKFNENIKRLKEIIKDPLIYEY